MKQVVIGTQWGDEGKGKIVDFLAKDADLVVRFSGGANAGHTIVTEKDTFKLHLIPSGIVYPHTKVVLGTGMVIDTKAFHDELDILTQQGIDWEGRIFISDRAHHVLPEYRDEDVKRDKERENPIGTTGRGIGIAYEKKVARDGIRICDTEYNGYAFERKGVKVINLPYFMQDYKNKNVVFEGAQGALLDIDVGTYPYVSSGSAIGAGAASGGGVGITDIDRVIGVFKAYQSRVGNGPFPTKFNDDEFAQYIRDTGREYGVTTGRPRDVGYLDLVALKYSCLVNGLNSLVLTHLDVYDNMDEIKVCVSYDGNKEFPSAIQEFINCRPIYKVFQGWKKDISGIKKIEDLPLEARQYIDFIEEYTGVEVGIISVGYKREQTIENLNIW